MKSFQSHFSTTTVICHYADKHYTFQHVSTVLANHPEMRISVAEELTLKQSTSLFLQTATVARAQ